MVCHLNLYIREMYKCNCGSSLFGGVVTLGNSIFFCKCFSKCHKKLLYFFKHDMMYQIHFSVQESDCKVFVFHLRAGFFTQEKWNRRASLFLNVFANKTTVSGSSRSSFCPVVMCICSLLCWFVFCPVDVSNSLFSDFTLSYHLMQCF